MSRSSASASSPATCRCHRRCRTRCTRSSSAGRRLPCTSARPPRWSSRSRPLSTSTAATAWGTSGSIWRAGWRPRTDAVDALLKASHEHAGTLTLVTLGPLTNVARALQRDPSLPERIARCVVMGAVADHVGNTNPVAEFNMWVDPHAVDLVLRSELAVELVGWDISRHYAVLDPDDAVRDPCDRHAAGRVLHRHPSGREHVRAARDETGRLRPARPDRDGLRDRPGESRPRPVASTARSRPRARSTRGMVVMDLLGLTGREPNALVVMAADRDRFLAMLRDSVS